jgi:hypothetical protein
MAQTTASVFHSLSPDEQARTAIYGQWYGIAGAIDFYGAELGLPKAVSGHLTYFYWGPREYTGEIVIVLGAKQPRQLSRYFDSVEPVAVVRHPYTMPDNNFTIYLCRGMKRPLAEVWPDFKNWN